MRITKFTGGMVQTNGCLVEIDNSLPSGFQLLDLRGFPKREEDGADGKETWGLYYVDESFSTALELIDSALLTIERGK